ncbi:uncharacterized protein LACBIDRAFT_294495 [Laccaria bicolor S238N-H82]|uniref:Predicted protein n=1 Tax=Laccaria bicolor (strain S238N-H82 / ATCC MYA-4686) TaxID=486041 RepID=B0DCK9_LACBS|nr:uncharacterized protein LACBIDRAFT_294495 [Laccaria bicolor S238N-H82]EDR07915.1 predicted protein [Laccaria bicolor S238N-H82]|eukprot:XP_001881704.1 predicted protein [Laccaria bicolor S238N-H82]
MYAIAAGNCDISCRQIKLLISTTSSTTSPSSLLKHSVLSTHLLLVPQCFEWKNSFRGEEPRLPGHQPSQVQELHSRLPEPFTPNQLGHYRIYLIQTSIHPFDIISLRRFTLAPSGDPHSMAHVTHAVSSPLPSPSTQCPHGTPNHAALSPWRFSALIKSSPANTLFATRTRVFDPYGKVPVYLNTEGAREMTTTMPFAVHASEDGAHLSIWGVVPAPDYRGLRVIVANGQSYSETSSSSYDTPQSPSSSPQPPLSFALLLALLIGLPFTHPMPQPHRKPHTNPTTHGNNPPLQQPKSPPPPSPFSSTRRSAFTTYLGLATPIGRNLAMSLYKLEMEHLDLTGSDAKEPFRFAMDVEKVYSGANGSSAGRRVPFNARVVLPPMTICHGQLSQSWALSGEVLTSLMRMEGEEEDYGDVWSDEAMHDTIIQLGIIHLARIVIQPIVYQDIDVLPLRDSELGCVGLEWNARDRVDTTLVWSRRRRCLRGSIEQNKIFYWLPENGPIAVHWCLSGHRRAP